MTFTSTQFNSCLPFYSASTSKSQNTFPTYWLRQQWKSTLTFSGFSKNKYINISSNLSEKHKKLTFSQLAEQLLTLLHEAPTTSLYIPPLGFVHWLCRCLIICRQPMAWPWCYGEPIGSHPHTDLARHWEIWFLCWRHSSVTKCSIHKIHQSFGPFAITCLHWCH